jgi:hypothetical protein
MSTNFLNAALPFSRLQFLKHILIPFFRHLFCCKHIERLLAEVWLTNKATKFLPGKGGPVLARGCGDGSSVYKKKRYPNFVSDYEAFLHKYV